MVNDGTTGSQSRSPKIRAIRRPAQRQATSPDSTTPDRKFVYPDPDLEALLQRKPADEPAESDRKPQPASAKLRVTWQRGAEFGLLAIMLAAGTYIFMLDQRSDIDSRFGDLKAQLDEVIPAPSAIDNNARDIRSLDQRLTLQDVRLERLETSQLRISDQLQEIADVLEETKAPPLIALTPVAVNATALPTISRGAPLADTVSPTPHQDQARQPPILPVISNEQSHWHINLASYDRRSMAEAWARKPVALGHPTEIVPVTASGRQFFRIRVAGGNDKDGTRELAASLQQQLGLQGVWISRKPTGGSTQPSTQASTKPSTQS